MLDLLKVFAISAMALFGTFRQTYIIEIVGKIGSALNVFQVTHDAVHSLDEAGRSFRRKTRNANSRGGRLWMLCRHAVGNEIDRKRTRVEWSKC